MCQGKAHQHSWHIQVYGQTGKGKESEVVMVVSVKMDVLWVVALCSLVEV
jgi:hypothetical protein